MGELLHARRKAIMMTVGWWYLRRFVRKRGTAAVAGLIAGEGLSLAGRSQKRHPIRWVVLLTLVSAGGYLLWRRRHQGGDDGWDGWEPAEPVTGPPEQDLPVPGPVAA